MRALNRNGLMQKEKQDPFTEYIFQFAEKILKKQMWLVNFHVNNQNANFAFLKNPKILLFKKIKKLITLLIY